MYTDIVCCLLYIYIYTYSYIYTIYKHVIWLVVYESKVFASFWVELSLHLMYKSSKPWMVIWWPSAGLMRRWVRMAVCILSPLASKSCASFVWAMILSCWPVRCTILDGLELEWHDFCAFPVRSCGTFPCFGSEIRRHISCDSHDGYLDINGVTCIHQAAILWFYSDGPRKGHSNLGLADSGLPHVINTPDGKLQQLTSLLNVTYQTQWFRLACICCKCCG